MPSNSIQERKDRSIVENLMAENRRLLELLAQPAILATRPAPIILCHDCPNRKVIEANYE